MPDMIALTDAPAMAILAEGDIEAGRRFWRDTLGFEEVDYDEGQRQATYRGAQGSWFGIYQHEGGSKCDHTQLGFTVSDLGAAAGMLRGRGIEFEEYDLPYLKTMNGVAEMGDGSKAAWFKDPGGNIVGLFQPSMATWQKMQSMMPMASAMRT